MGTASRRRSLHLLTSTVVAALASLSVALPALAQTAPAPVWNIQGAYRHVEAPELESGAFVAGLPAEYGLITVRGATGGAPGLKELMQVKGDMKVLLYKRGTAISAKEEAELLESSGDWILRDSGGQIVRSKAGAAVIDITNPAVRAWLVDEIAADVPARGFDGTYVDVLGVYFAPNFYTARPVINGQELGDAAWRDASIALTNQVKAATGKPVVVNGFGIQSGSDYSRNQASSDKLIAAADGIQIEHFTRVANQPAGKFRGIAAWKKDIALQKSVSSRGKVVLANTRVSPETDTATVERSLTFALASFLVGMDGSSVFQFYPGEYGLYTEQTVERIGSRVKTWEPVKGLIMADFTGGELAVNNTTSDRTVTLEGIRVTVGPQQAAISISS